MGADKVPVEVKQDGSVTVGYHGLYEAFSRRAVRLRAKMRLRDRK